MGTTAARKARTVVENVAHVLAIELMCACQALEFRGPEKLAPLTRKIYDLVREVATPLEDDRWLYPDIEAITELVVRGEIAQAVKAAK